MPVPALTLLYGNRLPEEIATLNKLCEKCRSRKASERIKDGQTGNTVEVKE
jgi:hypothetical protein